MRQRVDAPKVLRPEDITVIVDTREKAPWCLEPLRCERGTLVTGDYTIRGLEALVVLERKSLPDFAACCGSGRERFERELDRMRAFPHRALVLEVAWHDIASGGWLGLVTPSAVMSSVASWTAEGIPVIMAGDRAGAADFAKRFLVACARHEHRKLRAFAGTLAATA